MPMNYMPHAMGPQRCKTSANTIPSPRSWDHQVIRRVRFLNQPTVLRPDPKALTDGSADGAGKLDAEGAGHAGIVAE